MRSCAYACWHFLRFSHLHDTPQEKYLQHKTVLYHTTPAAKRVCFLLDISSQRTPFSFTIAAEAATFSDPCVVVIRRLGAQPVVKIIEEKIDTMGENTRRKHASWIRVLKYNDELCKQFIVPFTLKVRMVRVYVVEALLHGGA